jgi:hypothetical protein
VLLTQTVFLYRKHAPMARSSQRSKQVSKIAGQFANPFALVNCATPERPLGNPFGLRDLHSLAVASCNLPNGAGD